MKYGYAVKKNGVLYVAGEEVPVVDLFDINSRVEVTSDHKPASEEVNYKKSDITRMNVEGLKALALELGIEVTEESTGAKLKEEIIAKLGL